MLPSVDQPLKPTINQLLAVLIQSIECCLRSPTVARSTSLDNKRTLDMAPMDLEAPTPFQIRNPRHPSRPNLDHPLRQQHGHYNPRITTRAAPLPRNSVSTLLSQTDSLLQSLAVSPTMITFPTAIHKPVTRYFFSAIRQTMTHHLEADLVPRRAP